MLEVIYFYSILRNNPIPKMMKILGLFLGLIYISLTPLSAGASDLHTAAKKGDIATITSLLDKGADIEARDSNGNTPCILRHGLATSTLSPPYLTEALIFRPLRRIAPAPYILRQGKATWKLSPSC